MRYYWWCLHCDEDGEYEHVAKGEHRGKGTPQRHTDETAHTTVASMNPRPE